MKCFVVIATMLKVVLCGHVSVQTPYINPAGITYLPGPQLSAASLNSAPGYTSTYHGNGHYPQRLVNPFAPVQYAATQYATSQYAGTPFAPAQYAHTAYHGAAVVPTVHQVPAIANIPVTHIKAQPGFIQKELDVVKPAVKTSRFELRRPAIQKQFYDIEERVIVRPAGSALVELDHPHSKVHKSSVVSPVAPAHHFGHFGIAASPVFVQPSPPSFVPTQPTFGTTPQPINTQDFASDDDTIVVEARRRPEDQQPQQKQAQEQQQEQQVQEQQVQQPHQLAFRSMADVRFGQNQVQQILQQQQPQQQLFRTSPQIRFGVDQAGNQQRLIELLTAQGGVADIGFGRSQIIGDAGAVRNALSNRGETTRAQFRDNNDAGSVRARVLSAEYAPKDAPITGERVNTRRVVVSRPIETVEEVDVLEPVTKYERVAVQHPAVFKSAHVGIARVPTSLPVYGKTVYPHPGIYYN